MSEIDVSQLFRAIRTLSRSGMSILYVSHRPDEIPRVADRVSVIKDGRNLGTMSADETNLQSVVEMLVAETSQAMALREADRLRREFVSLVSHELRTPLATIQGYAETVISRPWSEEIRQECLEAITSGCERLTELVDNLLDISSLEKGVLRVDQELIDLPDLTNRIVHTGSRNRNRSADIAIHFPDVFPVIKADPKRIEQVLQNFIDNAVKYSSSGNSIRIYGVVDEEQQMIVVTVEDQGMGIPAEHLNRVFERFYRVPSNETVGIEGSGLGLAICKGIVEQHGGRIWARSIPGRGSAFSFSLPLDIEPIVNDALA
jgi:two-component system sensor histidine kinase VicK